MKNIQIENMAERPGRVGIAKRRTLVRIALVIIAIALPVIAWAQWTTSSNDIYNSNSGNVGIGTSAPGRLLHLSAMYQPGLGITDTGGTSGHKSMGFIYDGGGIVSGGGLVWQAFSDAGAFAANLTTFFRDGSVNFGGITAPYSSGDVVITGGYVGIGTTTPATALDVEGDVTVSGNISAKYADLAEWVPASQIISPGTVVILDPDVTNAVIPSNKSYDTRVAGVVSPSPGIVLGEPGKGKVKVATTGRVKVHVDASLAPIQIGDLLVTSGKEGVAMRSEAVTIGGIEFHRPGTLIGKALEPLNDGEGEILVLLSLQ